MYIEKDRKGCIEYGRGVVEVEREVYRESEIYIGGERGLNRESERYINSRHFNLVTDL